METECLECESGKLHPRDDNFFRWDCDKCEWCFIIQLEPFRKEHFDEEEVHETGDNGN